MTSSTAEQARILTINTGSSSLKAGLYAVGGVDPTLVASFEEERIGDPRGRWSVSVVGEDAETGEQVFDDHAAALQWLLSRMNERSFTNGLLGVGHRIVHGGSKHSAPERIGQTLLDDLRATFPIDPEHLPQAVAGIEAIAATLPDLPQIACFDTSFHQSMPIESWLLPLPRWLEREGVRRYGFHGLSYESVMTRLEREDPALSKRRIVIAHLGAGASMVAVRDGKSLDTTMGFTPTGGLMMGTRPGDLDPGLLLYLLQVRGMSGEEISRLLNSESGLLGVSETSQDVRDLLAVADRDPRANQAISLFCHSAKKHLAALVATLGGLDLLVFTGGIGEHAAPIRARICAGLAYMGIVLDPETNAVNAPSISLDERHCAVRIMHAEEDVTVARHTARLLQS